MLTEITRAKEKVELEQVWCMEIMILLNSTYLLTGHHWSCL